MEIRNCVLVVLFILNAGPCLSLTPPSRAFQLGRPAELMSRSSLQFSKNNEADDSDNNVEIDSPPSWNPMQVFQRSWDAFSTASIYRTLLFTAALSGSKSLREYLGAPGFFLIFAASWAYNTYESSFNYLVDVVTPKRQAAVQAIRQAQTERLNGSNQGSASYEENMQTLLEGYEESLREELQTRVIVPKLLVIPMDENQEDRSLAKQWLGLEITENYDLVPIEKGS